MTAVVKEAVALLDSEFEKLRTHVYRRCGIFVGDDKAYFLESRAISRMEALNMDRFTDYFRYLVLEADGEEYRQLINCITVNETFFFRDYRQLTGFAEEILPNVLDAKRQAKDYSLKILSAGCSTGEEPYSLAIILREMIPDFERWVIQIDGIDINTEVLEFAQAALYGSRATRDIPITFRLTYFEDASGDTAVKPVVRNMVRFLHVNMYNADEINRFAGVDVIFCRNVLIYFDDQSRSRVLNNLYNILQPGGYIFLGYAESVSRYSGAYEVIKIGDLITHRRPVQAVKPLKKGDGS